MPTFILVGAGCGLSDSYPEALRLPTAWQLREELLAAHFGNVSAEENLKCFKEQFGISEPTPDQVWQELIRSPSKLEDYTERIFDLFNPAKPIPPTYYLLAGWYFLDRSNVCGFATTNFDLQLPRAFRNVAESLNKQFDKIDKRPDKTDRSEKKDKQFDKNYTFAQIPEDFSYLRSIKLPPSRVVQQLHGSLARPWSIVAGAKRNIHALSNLLFEHDQSSGKNVFRLIRRFLDIADPEGASPEPVKFPPYEYLKESLAQASRVIFIGYSFKDIELVNAISSAVEENANLIVVDSAPQRELWPDFLKRAEVAKVSAEVFLKAYIQALRSNEPLIILPSQERDVLRKGPQYIEGYPYARKITTPDAGEPSSFLDPVYGTIAFSESIRKSVMAVVDTGELQRLRQIRQLSFVNLKYHGATHDRFSHSLGVAFLADKAFQSVRAESTGAKKSDDLHLAFTVAALIHDIGHGPYGHTMDLVRMELGDRQGHEDDTGRIFKQMFDPQRCFADLDIALNDIAVSRNDLQNIIDITHPLGRILSNPGCDIDRLDFVMRDAATTLASIAEKSAQDSKDLEQLVTNYGEILRAIHLFSDKDSTILCYQPHVRPSLLAFARLYCKLYQKVYYCWQNTAARVMLSSAVVEMVRSQKVELEDLKPLTDIELLATLEEFEHPRVREMAYLVKYRRLYQLVTDVSIDKNSERDFFPKSDEEVVRDFTNLDYKKGMLVARLKSKNVVCRFTDESGSGEGETLFSQKCSEEEELARTDARLMVFQPPV